MTTIAEDSMNGCIHGSTTDETKIGLTKLEWLVGCAMQGNYTPNMTPIKYADWAFQCAHAAIDRINRGVASAVPTTDDVDPVNV